MMGQLQGLHHLHSSIRVQAAAEACYTIWTDSPKLPRILKRVLGIGLKPVSNVTATLTSLEEIQTRLQKYKISILPAAEIKHWLFQGPGAKLYQIENTAILEIPYRFYCTISTDPDDICAQSSLTFTPDAQNHETLIEWKVSFWGSSHNGSMTQLASDIAEMDDSFLEDCLQEFKTYVENREQYLSSQLVSQPES